MAYNLEVLPRYLNVETLLRFLEERGTSSSTDEWRRIIRNGECNETQIEELQDAIKVFMSDATSAVVRAVNRKYRRVRSPPRPMPDDHSPLRFTGLSQFDDYRNSQESSNSSIEVILDQYYSLKIVENAWFVPLRRDVMIVMSSSTV